MSDLAATQPIENANPAMETEAEVQPKALFKKKRAPTTGTKGAKQTGGSAKSAAAGKQQRKSVKAAAAKPVAKKPKQPKKTAKTACPTSKSAPKTPRKKKSPAPLGASSAAAGTGEANVATEGSKFDAIVEMLVQMANDRIAAGQAGAGASSSAPAADSTSAGSSNPTAPEVGAHQLPNLVGRVTGV